MNDMLEKLNAYSKMTFLEKKCKEEVLVTMGLMFGSSRREVGRVANLYKMVRSKVIMEKDDVFDIKMRNVNCDIYKTNDIPICFDYTVMMKNGMMAKCVLHLDSDSNGHLVVGRYMRKFLDELGVDWKTMVGNIFTFEKIFNHNNIEKRRKHHEKMH